MRRDVKIKSGMLPIVFYLFLIYGTLGYGLNANASTQKLETIRKNITQCSYKNFSSFLNTFSESIEFQTKHTFFPLKKSILDINAEPEPRVIVKLLYKSEINFPIIPNKRIRNANALILKIVGPNAKVVKVTLTKEDTDYQISYLFMKDSCWNLVRIEDWSM